jgi:type I restriction enzyme S subunit
LTASEYQDEGYIFLSTPNIKHQEIDYDNVNYIPKWRYEESPELKLDEGDVLLAKDGFTLGTVNLVKKLPGPATVNGSIAILRPHSIHPEFLRYAIACSISQAHIGAVKDGMDVLHLFQRDIRKIPLPVPPLEEQRRIADYLDAQTARLNEAVERRVRQCGLLEMHRWASLHERIQATDVGRLPLRRVLLSLIDGPFGSAFTSSDYSDEGASVVRLGNIGFAEYRGEEQARIPLRLYREFASYAVRPGDLLIAALGDSRNHAGRACVAPDLGPAIVKGKCFRGRIDPSVASAGFIALLLASPIGAAAIEGRGSTRSMVNLEIVKSAALPIPSLAEQVSILDSVDSTHAVAMRARTSCLRHIQLLRERREALLTAAVTGQFDVSTASGRGIEDGLS